MQTRFEPNPLIPAAPAGLTTELTVQGMTCSGCARHVTEALQDVSGVASAFVLLEEGRAKVRWQSHPNVAALLEAVHEAGFAARAAEAPSAHAGLKRWSPLAGWQFNVVAGSLATAPLLASEWVFHLGLERWYQWLAFALALPVQILCGARFYRGAWNQLKAGSSNMDTLVALGSTTAFLFSMWGLLAGWQTHLFFMESAAIITLISLGHWLEAKATARAASSLRALLDLAPQTARQLDPTGSEIEVPVAALRLDDIVLLKPGDRVPTDGEAIEGNSAVDEAMLTGESLPVDKAPGSRLYAGTANLNGRLLLRVTAIGESTALAQIISVVERAQNSRANIQKLGDRVSSVFVPVVVLLAVATGLWWGLAPEPALQVSRWLEALLWTPHRPEGALASAIFHAAAVLIIACPCAMGLATPVAIMAGTNAAAQRGILIRDGAALEKSGRITMVLFDKTGTLTEGKVSVAATEDYREPSRHPASLEALAASLAKPSNHPLSQTIARLANDPFPAVEWQEVRGCGVQGKLQIPEAHSGAKLCRLGSLSWLREAGVDLRAAPKFADQWSAKGATVLGLAADQKLAGLLALRDTVKPHSAEVIAQLRAAGKRTCLVTGDHARTADALAEQVGMRSSDVYAEVRPEQKARLIEQLQRRGERVAFVGDGINDALALEQADLGIAVSRASDVAREAADIILLKSDIQAIPEALGLAQATLRTIRQNLFWAFFYNAAGIPLAMLGFLSPMVSAAAMGLSDLIVIGNALRLRRRKNS